MKPICVQCQRFYRPKKNGFTFIEGMPRQGNPIPGTLQSDQWVPYKIWRGDLWECQGCGHQIISGTGLTPVMEHYELEFDAFLTLHGITYQVNDC